MTRVRLKRTLQASIGGLWGREPLAEIEAVTVVRVADFDYEALAAGDASTMRAVEPHLLARRLLLDGDLLIEKSGGGDRQNVGRVVRWTGSQRAICSNFVNVLRPVSGVDARWLTYLHRSLYLAGFAATCTRQTTGIQNLDLRMYLGARVDILPLRDQHHVADFLDYERKRIAELLGRIDLLVATMESWSQQWIADRLHERASEQLLLRRVIRDISDGPFGSSLAAAHYVDAPEVRVIRLGNIGDAEFRNADRAYVSHEYAEIHLGEHFVRPGDLVMAGLGDERHRLGRACVVPRTLGPAIHKADCYRVRVDTGRVLPSYAAWALSYGPSRQQAELLARGATRARLNTAVARDLPLPWMPLDEQARLVEEAEDRRTRERRLLGRVSLLKERLAEYRDALITEAVTGQLDVTRLSDSQLDESAHAAMGGERPEVLTA